jgi:hypothetical protein
MNHKSYSLGLISLPSHGETLFIEGIFYLIGYILSCPEISLNI